MPARVNVDSLSDIADVAPPAAPSAPHHEVIVDVAAGSQVDEIATNFGIDEAGNAYYDADGVAPGQGAVVVLDSHGNPILVSAS